MRKIMIRDYAREVASDLYNKGIDFGFALEDNESFYGIRMLNAIDNWFIVIGFWGMGDTVAYDMVDCDNNNMSVEDYLTQCICDYLNNKCGYNNCDGGVEIWI